MAIDLRACGRTVIGLGALTLGALPARSAPPPYENGRKLDSQVVQTVGPAGESKGGPTEPRIASLADRQGASAASDSIARAKKAIGDCQERYQQVSDYTCTFVKRERIDGRLTAPHVMVMKARTSPSSLYFKFHQPNQGREAIYVQGRNGGRIVAHDVGLGKILAGTMHLDPRGSMAMEDNRHPVTEAGIGSLIDSVSRHWAAELAPADSVITFDHDAQIGNQRCTMIESMHPQRKPHFLFYKVKIYIDQERGLPVHFEAYDWPRQPGGAAELIEQYSYLDLKVNVGLRDHDFDPANRQYSFGRF